MFDMVDYQKLIKCLNRIGMDGKDIRLIVQLHWEQRAVIRTEKELISEFNMEKRMRQGCVLSSALSYLYTEMIFRHC